MTLRAQLETHGWALLRAPDLVRACEGEAWTAAEAICGEPLALVERQPIRPVPHGRSFASTMVDTPLHTDAQSHFGVAPHLQVMACHRAADSGGQTLLLDTWALVRTLDGDLSRALVEVPRRHRFVFGDVYGPTLGLRGDALVFTHSPIAASDRVGERLALALAAAPRIEVTIAADEVLVVHNHRMLHGRHAFADPHRRFTRLLAWTHAPFPAPLDLHAAADTARRDLDHALRDEAPWIRERFGLAAPPDGTRLQIVVAMLRGEAPGILAARHGVPEPTLYRWRDAALRAAAGTLAATADAEPALQNVLARFFAAR